MINFNNHRVWHECHNILAKIDANTLALNYLCFLNVCNYDGEFIYENITLIAPLQVELVNTTLGYTREEEQGNKWMKFCF